MAWMTGFPIPSSLSWDTFLTFCIQSPTFWFRCPVITLILPLKLWRHQHTCHHSPVIRMPCLFTVAPLVSLRLPSRNPIYLSSSSSPSPQPFLLLCRPRLCHTNPSNPTGTCIPSPSPPELWPCPCFSDGVISREISGEYKSFLFRTLNGMLEIAE